MSSQSRHRSHSSMDFQDQPYPPQLNLRDYIFLIKNKQTEFKRIMQKHSQLSIKAQFEKICLQISQGTHHQESSLLNLLRPLNKILIEKSLSHPVCFKEGYNYNPTIESNDFEQLAELINQCKLILINLSNSEEPPNTQYSQGHELNKKIEELCSLKQQAKRLRQYLDREEFLIDIIRLNEEATLQMEGRLMKQKQEISNKIEDYIYALQESHRTEQSLKVQNERLAQQLMLSNITNERLFEQISKIRRQNQRISFAIRLVQQTFSEQSQRKLKIIMSQLIQLKSLQDLVHEFKTQLDEKTMQLAKRKARSELAQEERASLRERLKKMQRNIQELILHKQSQSTNLFHSKAQNQRLSQQKQTLAGQFGRMASNLQKMKVQVSQTPPLYISLCQNQREYTGIHSQYSPNLILIKTKRKSENLKLQTVEEEDLKKLSKNYNISTSEYEVSPQLDNFEAQLQEHSDDEESFGKQMQNNGLGIRQQSLAQRLCQLKYQYDKMEDLFGPIINRMKDLSQQNLFQFAHNITQSRTYVQRLMIADKFIEPLKDHLKVMKEAIELADHLQKLKQERKSLDRTHIFRVSDSQQLNDEGNIVQLQQLDEEMNTQEIQRLDIFQLFQLLFKQNVSFVQKYKEFVYKTLQLFAQKGTQHQQQENNDSSHIISIKGKNQKILKEIFQMINKKYILTDNSPCRFRQFAIIKQQFLKSSSKFTKNLTEYNEHCKRRLIQILDQVKSGDFKIKDLQKSIIALQIQLDDHKQKVQEQQSQILITLNEYKQMRNKVLERQEQLKLKGRKQSPVVLESKKELCHWKLLVNDQQESIDKIAYEIVQIQPQEMAKILQFDLQ